MSDKREQAIKTLEDIIEIAGGIKGLSEDAGIIISLDKISDLKFALESIKVDRAYDLAYEKVDFIEIPEGATNGDMIMSMFPNGDLHNKETEGDDWEISYPKRVCYEINYYDLWFDEEWWDSPYRKEQE